jgi:hypothetical protein
MSVTRERRPRSAIAPEPATERPVVLVVAISESVHTARWLDLSAHGPFRYVLCPVFGAGTVQEMMAACPLRRRDDLLTVAAGEIAVFDTGTVPPDQVAAVDAATGFRAVPSLMAGARGEVQPAGPPRRRQFSGYLALAARQYLGDAFRRGCIRTGAATSISTASCRNTRRGSRRSPARSTPISPNAAATWRCSGKSVFAGACCRRYRPRAACGSPICRTPPAWRRRRVAAKS